MLQFVALTGTTKRKRQPNTQTKQKRCGSCLNDTDKKANNLVWREGGGKDREEQISNKSKKTHDLTFVSYI